jgi:hypothetical protein
MAFAQAYTGGLDSVVCIATRYGMSVRASNLGGGKVFLARPDRPQGLSNLPVSGLSAWVKTAKAWLWIFTPPKAEVVYGYLPSVPSRHVIGWPFPLEANICLTWEK